MLDLLYFWQNNLVMVTRYMAPLQGVVSMDGTTVTPTPIQVHYFCSFFSFLLKFWSSSLFSFLPLLLIFLGSPDSAVCEFMQPLFSQPRPKRCATHCHIARNIQCLQQFMKMNPFWPAPAGSASLFGSKPCNLNVMPAADLHGNISVRAVSNMQDKGQSSAGNSNNGVKEKGSQPAATPDSAQRKQQILIQQALPPVAPSNLLVCLFGP